MAFLIVIILIIALYIIFVPEYTIVHKIAYYIICGTAVTFAILSLLCNIVSHIVSILGIIDPILFLSTYELFMDNHSEQYLNLSTPLGSNLPAVMIGAVPCTPELSSNSVLDGNIP